jgi:hypothetical protein
MSSSPLPLDYASTARSPLVTVCCLLPACAFLLSFLNVNFTTCACGYQSFLSLPGNLIGAGLAATTFVLFKPRVDRLIAAATCVPCIALLTLNIHNILWSGHNPLFP